MHTPMAVNNSEAKIVKPTAVTGLPCWMVRPQRWILSNTGGPAPVPPSRRVLARVRYAIAACAASTSDRTASVNSAFRPMNAGVVFTA
jgi:hypothetical protein